MNNLFKLAAAFAFTGSFLAAQAQEGGKMLKKEGKTDDKMLRENRRMMKDGKVKHDENMRSEPKLVKKEERMDRKKGHK